MKLKLKESNSPFWLIGTGKNGTFAGSSTNIPCYYKSKNKQIEISKQIFKNDKNVEKVYLLSGTQWDNMPSGSKEELGYIKNKGKLILSREDIEECDYPKDVSRDSLPKKGIKTYTSTATTLENKEDSKIKLELKDSNVNNKSKFDDLLANGTQADFNKLPKDEIKEFANYVKSLDDVSDLIKGIICKGQWTFSPIINEEERYYIYGIPYNKEYISLMRGDKLPVLKNYELGPIPFEFKTQRYPAYIN